MSHEIRHNPGVSGRTYWAELYDVSKNVWDTSTNTFRDELVVTPAHRAIVMSDFAGSGKYWADLPEVPAGVGYQWFVRRQATGSPAIGDAIELVGDVFAWDGIRVYALADVILVNGAALGAATSGMFPADLRAVYGTALSTAYVPANLLKINGSDFTLLRTVAGITVKQITPTDSDGNTTIVQGDDYTSNAIGDNRLTYTITGFAGTVSGATVTWKIVPRSLYDKHGTSAAELTVTTGAASLAGEVLTLKVPLTQAQTAALRHPQQTDARPEYKVQVALVGSDGKILTQVLGDGVVLKQVS
jgi:hypothetical protein